MPGIAKTYLVSEIESASVGDYIKVLGKVVEISRDVQNELLLVTLLWEGAEIGVRIFDVPTGFVDAVLQSIEVGDYVVVLGYYKSWNDERYILATGINKISEKAVQYYLARRA